MVRDSYGANVVDLFGHHFSESTFIFDAWHHALNKHIVEEVKPDVFIQFALETIFVEKLKLVVAD